MKRIFVVLAVIAVVLFITALGMFGWVKNLYNTMVSLDEEVNGAWAQVENQLQRRYDLVPNLVETVKGYASHEKEVLTRVTEARARVGGATTPDARMKAEGELSQALSRLLMVVENYPQLKANQNFVMLQDQLEGTENRIAVERRRYNEAVRRYNTYIRRFPQSVFAGMFNFEKRAFFEAAEGAKEVPKVSFD